MAFLLCLFLSSAATFWIFALVLLGFVDEVVFFSPEFFVFLSEESLSTDLPLDTVLLDFDGRLLVSVIVTTVAFTFSSALCKKNYQFKSRPLLSLTQQQSRQFKYTNRQQQNYNINKVT